MLGYDRPLTIVEYHAGFGVRDASSIIRERPVYSAEYASTKQPRPAGRARRGSSDQNGANNTGGNLHQLKGGGACSHVVDSTFNRGKNQYQANNKHIGGNKDVGGSFRADGRAKGRKGGSWAWVQDDPKTLQPVFQQSSSEQGVSRKGKGRKNNGFASGGKGKNCWAGGGSSSDHDRIVSGVDKRGEGVVDTLKGKKGERGGGQGTAAKGGGGRWCKGG